MAPKTQLAVGVDAGSSRTRCIVCTLENDQIRYLSHGLAHTAGWAKGRVSDQEALAESIRCAVVDAERGAHVSMESVTVGVGGTERLRAARAGAVYEFEYRPREVDAEDMAYAVKLASDVRLERDRMLLHVLPQDFTLDGRAGARKPQKGVCSRLEANVHIVTASYQEHQAVVAATHIAGLAVEETVFEPMAAAYACLYPEERARGGVARPRPGSAFDRPGGLRWRRIAARRPVFPSGPTILTRDVAGHFQSHLRRRRKCLKLSEYGCALLGLTSDSRKPDRSSFARGPSGPREARRSVLSRNSGSARRRAVSAMSVRNCSARAWSAGSAGEGILLTGSGALLNGMCDMAERVLNCQAGNALAERLRGLARGIEYACVDHGSGPRALFGETEAPSAASPAVAGADGLGSKVEAHKEQKHGARYTQIRDGRRHHAQN